MSRLYRPLVAIFSFLLAISVVGPLGNLIYDHYYKRDTADELLSFAYRNWPWFLLSFAILGGTTFLSWRARAVERASRRNSSKESASAPIPTRLHQLRPPLDDFTGRTEELSELTKIVKERRSVGVILHGMAGVGKTVLALKLADGLSDIYPDAQLYIDLKGTSPSPLSSRDAMSQTIRSYYPAAQIPEGDSELSGFYQSTLKTKRCLLVLDDAVGKEQVDTLIPPGTSLVLITSRQRFVLPGFITRDIETLAPDAATALLLAICPRIGAMAEPLASKVEYLPLALRLVASSLAKRTDLTPTEYLRRISDDSERLKLSGAEASLRSSYSLLPIKLQEQWRKLTIFRGGFDLAAAAAVWDVGRDNAQDTLSILLEYSVLQWNSRSLRYRLHDLLNLLAEQLLSEPERKDIFPRYAKHYATVLQVAEELYLRGSEDIKRGLLIFDQDWENVSRGHSWVTKELLASDVAANLCIEYTRAAPSLLQLRLKVSDRVRWLGAALTAARRLNRRDIVGVTFGNLGICYGQIGDYTQSLKASQQYLTIAKEMNDELAIGRALSNLGTAHRIINETPSAAKFYQESLAIARRLANERLEAIVLSNLAGLHADLGHPVESMKFAQESLSLAERMGDHHGRALAFETLGNGYRDLKRVRRAAALYNRALMIYQDIGARGAEGLILGHLGTLELMRGKRAKGLDLLNKQIEIAREVGDRRMEGVGLVRSGIVLYEQKKKDEAIKATENAVAILGDLGLPLASEARENLVRWKREVH